MHAYAKAIGRVPRRWAIPATQAGLIVVLIAFWALLSAGYEAASVAFYVLGLILGILLISQFWTLANDVYDPRQAKRIFGFIGGGAVLGGMTGAGITALIAETVGTNNLLLWSAAVLASCVGIVLVVLSREGNVVAGSGADDEQGVGLREALTLVRDSRQVQLIAVIITFGALGAAILDLQLSMATEEFKGRSQTDAITGYLGAVRFYLSSVGLVIQLFLTSRIHRLLGIGFALTILPVGLGVMAGVILLNYALWAPAVGSILDRSVRYTVDKTTREILFLPVPTDVKLQAKPFIDVTVDRLAKGFGALLLLVLIKPWGMSLTWQQLSVATLALAAVWLFMAVRATREYVKSFRRSIEQHVVEPADIRIVSADLKTIETLIAELGQTDERRVLYAIDLLESLEKRDLIPPLLLHHDSAAVRARALQALELQNPEIAARSLPAIERLLADDDPAVRAAAVRAIATIRGQEAAALMRQHLTDSDPRIVATAAVALAATERAGDLEATESALLRLAADLRETAAPGRLEAARALGEIPHERVRHMLVPLMVDPDVGVARAAIQSAGRLGPDTFLFVPPLVALLRHRLLKNDARAVLVGYGEAVVEPLGHFLHDQREELWVRR
ncbi:MAG: Npt1/Npt2 family nucleotide transporter, partial [Vicinamibacterales bacterium]